MDDAELLDLYDRYLRIELEIPGAERESFPGLVRFTRPAPGMNFVSYSRIDPSNLAGAIAEQVDFFTPFGQPFSWTVCDHDSPSDLMGHLIAHGFAPDDDPDAVLVLDVQEATQSLLQPGAQDVRRLERPEQLDDVVRVEEQVYGGDFSWLKGRLAESLGAPDYLSIYAAYIDGQPACVGWVFFYPRNPFAGLFGASTLPALRGRGLYTAVLAARVQEASRRGYRFLATGASPMSRPILARNGFRLLTHSHALEWRKDLAAE